MGMNKALVVETTVEVLSVPHAGGRPTKYREEFCNVVLDEYLQQCDDEYVERLKETRETEKGTYTTTASQLKAKFPTMEGYAIYLNVDTESLLLWGHKYK